MYARFDVILGCPIPDHLWDDSQIGSILDKIELSGDLGLKSPRSASRKRPAYFGVRIHEFDTMPRGGYIAMDAVRTEPKPSEVSAATRIIEDLPPELKASLLPFGTYLVPVIP